MLISVLGNETLSPGKWQQQFKVGLGLDLSSGTEVVLKAETHDGSPPASGEMQQAISVLQSRVNGTGSSGAQVQQQGSDMINVTVPGTPAYNVVSLVSQAAQMSVRPVYLEAPYVPPSAAKAAPVSYGDSTLVNAATLQAVRQGGVQARRRRRHGQPELAEDGRLLARRATSGTRSRARSFPATRAGPSTSSARPSTWAVTSRRSAPGSSRTAPSGW